MDSLRLPWRRRPSAPNVEPTLIAEHKPPAERDPEFNTSFEEHVCEPQDADPILSLIGGADGGTRAQQAWHDPGETPAASNATSAAPCAADLIATLHEQYWRALSDPQASVTQSWVDQSDEAPAHAIPHALPCDTDEEAAHGASAGTKQGNAGSIETLLAGESTIDGCFGRLEGRSAADPLGLAEDSEPEVLRLFAPPEYCAATQPHSSARASVLPPPLTRREHHVLSIDSPLVAPSCTERSAVSPDNLGSVEPALRASGRLAREAELAEAAVPSNAKAIDEQA
ncbi:TagK domain-containing protein [Trinickia sp.]|uniref:TagK domain-containing protein n=1 Tax=Trinickia sp. TaxID=2571163 RepID=UPI003F7D33C0